MQCMMHQQMHLQVNEKDHKIIQLHPMLCYNWAIVFDAGSMITQRWVKLPVPIGAKEHNIDR